MGSFNKDEALRIVMEGTDAEKVTLINELGRQLREKKFGLVWEHGGDGKNAAFDSEDIVRQYREHLPIPMYQEELSLIGKGEGTSESEGGNSMPSNSDANLLLEGDNYVWLKILEQTHAGKIDVIYIDPPYNTGNKDFVYNDHYVDSSDIFKHSKWLEFMFARLVIAKHLLSNDGVIFISIDEREISYLKILCDEIFSTDAFIACLPRITKKSGKSTNTIANNHDYLLIYGHHSKDVIRQLPHIDSEFKLTDEYVDQRGPYKLNQTLDYSSLQYSTSMDYPLTIAGHVYYPGGDYKSYCQRQSGNHKLHDWVWRWSPALVTYGLEHDWLVIKPNGRIYTKTYANARIVKGASGYEIEYAERTAPFSSLELTENQYSNDNSKKNFDSIGLDTDFQYSKPVSLIKKCCEIYYKQTNITVMDFFAGSGTTAQAVEELNAEDGGSRRWILVTNNEGETPDDPSTGIMRSVTKPRIDTVLTGIRPDGTKYSDGYDAGYSFFTYDITSVERSSSPNRNRRRLAFAQCLDGFIRIRWGIRRTDIRVLGSCFPTDYESDSTHVVAMFTTDGGEVTTEDIAVEAQRLAGLDAPQRILLVPSEIADVAKSTWTETYGGSGIELLSYDELFDNEFVS